MNFKEAVKRCLREKKGTKIYKFEKGKEWDMDDSEVSDIAKLEKKRKK